VAQQVKVILVDDIDGGEADETVSFSLDGAAYEIDLNAANAAKMREAIAPYVGTGRRVGGRVGRRRSGGSRGSAGNNRTAEMRAWAKSQGIKVSERGRIAADVVAQYESAH
jgi:nucleoid-associated protein Lsr2